MTPTVPIKQARGLPMYAERRIAIYQRENRAMRLTPRQRRRVDHKRNHAAAPFGKKAIGA